MGVDETLIYYQLLIRFYINFMCAFDRSVLQMYKVEIMNIIMLQLAKLHQVIMALHNRPNSEPAIHFLLSFSAQL